MVHEKVNDVEVEPNNIKTAGRKSSKRKKQYWERKCNQTERLKGET